MCKNLFDYIQKPDCPEHNEAVQYYKHLNKKYRKNLDLYKFKQFVIDKQEHEFKKENGKLPYSTDAIIGFHMMDYYAHKDAFLPNYRVGTPYGGEGRAIGNGSPWGNNQTWDIPVVDPKKLFIKDENGTITGLGPAGKLIREKFEKLITEGKNIGTIDAHEATMLSNFYSFANTVVKEIMVPRTEIFLINAEENINAVADLIINTGHTRIPIYKDNVDNIIGVINAKDVLKVIKNNNIDENFSIETLAREILIVPENKFISDLLSDFTSSKNQIAAVVDEHGGIAGIITIEDILEEIVGEIYDEFDKVDSPEVIKIDDNTLNVSCKMDIEDINERFDLDIPNEDFQTIGGYVFGLLGREPEVNDVIEDKNITYKVLELDGRRISRITMHKETPFVDATEQENETEENSNELN